MTCLSGRRSRAPSRHSREERDLRRSHTRASSRRHCSGASNSARSPTANYLAVAATSSRSVGAPGRGTTRRQTRSCCTCSRAPELRHDGESHGLTTGTYASFSADESGDHRVTDDSESAQVSGRLDDDRPVRRVRGCAAGWPLGAVTGGVPQRRRRCRLPGTRSSHRPELFRLPPATV